MEDHDMKKERDAEDFLQNKPKGFYPKRADFSPMALSGQTVEVCTDCKHPIRVHDLVGCTRFQCGCPVQGTSK